MAYLTTQFRRSFGWQVVAFLWLLAMPWLAHGQNTSPFRVNVTPAGPLSLSTGQSRVLKAEAVYPSFKVGSGFAKALDENAAYVQSLVLQPDGMVLAGGSFTSYKDTTRQYLVRLRPDGTLDPGFKLSGNGFDKVVFALARQPDGWVLVGGDFTEYSSHYCRHLARLDADGNLDETFAVGNSGFSNSINSFAVQPNTQIVVGGNFPSYYSNDIPTRVGYIARLNYDGTLDESFNSGGQGFSNSVATATTLVASVALQPDGKVLAGGDFDRYDDTPCGRVVRLDTAGSYDATFALPSGFFNGRVLSLVLQPDGKVLVGGAFSGYVARLNADGSPDAAFNSNIKRESALSGAVSYNSLALQPDGRIVVGGATGYLIRLNADGTRDASFNPTGKKFSLPSKPNDSFGPRVSSLVLQPNGTVLVGGAFDNYDNGATGSNNGIARLTSTGDSATAAIPVPGATYTWSNGSTGNSLLVNTTNTYSATATFSGQTATSKGVSVTVGGAPVAPFTVRVTPIGGFSVCPGDTQLLTAAVPGLGATQVPKYTWWKVDNRLSSATIVSEEATYSASSPGQYFATATLDGATGASSTITISTLATPTIAKPVSGLPGARVVLTGENLQRVTGVLLGTLDALFVVNSPTQLTITVPAGATSGDISLTTACPNRATLSKGFSVPPPTITDFTPKSGAPGTLVVVTGTGFIAGATTVYFSADPTPAKVVGTVYSSTQLTALVPPTATNGPLTVTTSAGSATSTASFTALAASGPPPLTITTTTTIYTTGALYNGGSPVVIAAPGNVTIMRNPAATTSTPDYITINNLDVRAGATLTIAGSSNVTGNGTFSLAAGATLNVGHPNGLDSTGAVSFGRRHVLSSDASYGYTGATAQATGRDLPRQVRNLTSANATSLTLTSPVAVAQVLTMAGAGNFYLNNQMLSLLSGASGTALVNNQGTGVVVGPATVQRYIDPSINPAAGFRYYGSPVSGATAAVLKAPAFAYDQTRSLNFAPQDTAASVLVGFVPTPLAANDALAVGQGYRAAVAASDTVRFVGTLTTGDHTVELARSSHKAYSGWNLVSNPYPSPLNWNKVAPADRPGLEAAIYVYESTGPGKGYFRNYVYKKVGTGDSLIAAGQAFFVRVRQNSAAPASTGQLIFRNSQRVTTFDTSQPTFNRTAQEALEAEAALNIVLDRNGGRCPCRLASTTAPAALAASQVILYADTDATPDFDPLLDADAGNLINFSQQTLGIRVGSSTRSSAATDTLALLAVQAVPPFNPARVTRLPLVLSATVPGSYTLTGTGHKLATLLNGTRAYLRDSSATTNRWVALPTTEPQTFSHNFSLTAAELLLKVKPIRFWLQFGPASMEPSPLATTPGAVLQSATVYPNPAHGQFSVWVPAVAGAASVQATLLNALGQVVQQQVAALPAAGATLRMSVPSQASGLYLLRLQAGDSLTVRRVVLTN